MLRGAVGGQFLGQVKLQLTWKRRRAQVRGGFGDRVLPPALNSALRVESQIPF